MSKVIFLKGLAAEYAALAAKDSNTFYHTTDDNQVYLGDIKISNAKDLADAVADLESDIKTNADNITLQSGQIGDLSNLTTTAKSDLVSAIEELKTAIGTNKTDGAITIDTTTTTDGYAKSYTVKQGQTTIGVIDIPKDMVVQSGVVKTITAEDATAELPAGTYIELTLANAASDKLYINVGTLIDIYTAEQNATQVQLTINSSTREISAIIVAESITSAELAADAVTTVKIADGNVTKAKLSTTLQASIDKADSAVQSVTSGTTNGTIAVDGVDIPVTGLKSAAYVETTAFDPAGSASTALSDAKDYVNGLLEWGSITITPTPPES